MVEGGTVMVGGAKVEDGFNLRASGRRGSPKRATFLPDDPSPTD